MKLRTGFHWLILGLPVALALVLVVCGGGSSTGELAAPSPTATQAPQARSDGTAASTVTPEPSGDEDSSGAGSKSQPTTIGNGSGEAAIPTSPPSPTATRSVPQGPVLGSADAYVEGVGEKQEIAGSIDHVDLNADPSDDIVPYTTFPPTSGDHWSAPVRCGFYIQAVPDEMVVHNMEHSNIIVSYNLTTREDLEALKNVYDELPELWRDHFTVVGPTAE